MTALQFHLATLALPRPRVDAATKAEQLVRAQLAKGQLAPGSTVALAVGSRKIHSLPSIVAQIASILKDYNCQSFIVPAMGSHAGASREGQLGLLASLGITQDSVGAPVRAGDEALLAGHLTENSIGQMPGSGPIEVWCDPLAWHADAIIPINRVKPHTAFRAPVESGPSKMVAVGLGKQMSAKALHDAGLAETIPAVVKFFLDRSKLAFGVAVVENGWGETADVALLEPARWLEDEARLLSLAWRLYPQLPWKELDLLIVERMGKDISGTGMDINVIGMGRRFADIEDGSISDTGPRIAKVVALELTAASGGNANGIGYADHVTAKLADAVDWELTQLNATIAGFPKAARCPVVAPDELSAISRALDALPANRRANDTCRAVRIKDTSNLTDLQLSQALLKELPAEVTTARGACP